MKRNLYTIFILILITTGLLASCQKPVESIPDATISPTATPLPTIEKITDAPITFIFLQDQQSSYVSLYHQLAYLRMEDRGYSVSNIYVDTNQDLTGVLSQLELEGTQYVVVTSSFLEEQVANFIEYSDSNMVFMQYSDEYMDMASSYEIKLYEYYYLSGIALGNESDSNIAGFIAANPDEQTIRCINAFALGMKKVDTDALVVVSWVQEAIDENTIAQTIENLSYQKCDVYAYFIQSDLVEKVSGNLGSNYMTMSTHIALNTDDRLIIKPSVNLDMYFESFVNANEHSLSYKLNYLGTKENILSYEIANSASENTKNMVADAYQEMLSGYSVFSGPIYNDIGLIVPEGSTLPDEDVLDMLWFVNNVIGELPAG